ncbi:MAG: DNA-directed DNA polymerase II small subunit [Candidatus Anstonellales archaeon]
MIKELSEKGIRITLDAEEILKGKHELIHAVLSLNKPLITKEDVEEIIKEKEKREKEKEAEKKEEVIVKRGEKAPEAKEYSPEISIDYKKDITGKSRTTGKVENFIEYFRNRYKKMRRLFFESKTGYAEMEIAELKDRNQEKVKIIGMVYKKSTTAKGNLLVIVEDLTGVYKVVIPKNNEKIFENAKRIVKDDIIAFYGKVVHPLLIADDFEWPDVPLQRNRNKSERDLEVAYISDIHFGSNKFLAGSFEKFLNYIKKDKRAGKIKYLVVAGDIVDGIGIYPNQEKELVVKDIEKQYEMFDDFVGMLPEYISVIIIPGNHDAVRRGEPMPAIENDLIKSDVIKVGSPARVFIDGVSHIIYHGTSLDSFIANIPKLSYTKPEEVMKEYLIRRHLSPFYGENPIIPEEVDYMVIDEVPDVMHIGHVHKNGYMEYRGTLLINSGTFQAQTEYQIKQGHVPTPGEVPVYNLKTGKLSTLKFV